MAERDLTPEESPPLRREGAGGASVGRLAAARARAREIPQRLNVARGRHPSLDTSYRLFERDRRLAASVLAGGIAFRLFLWLLPLALIIGGVLGFTSSEAAQDLADDLGLTAAAADAVGESVEDAGRGRWALLVIGLAGLIWTSSRTVLALRRVYALVWNVSPMKAKNPLVDALVFTGICVLLLSLAPAAGALRELAPGPGLAVTLLTVVAFFGIWLWVSTLLPHGDAPLRALVPGAVAVAVSFQLIHLFSAFYVAGKLERSSALYGGLGLAATFLFVLYIVGRVVVGSAMVNAELWKRRGPPLTHLGERGSRVKSRGAGSGTLGETR
jgi:uncharacterized BrkB/YihY/UPF0761 family membrane protein